MTKLKNKGIRDFYGLDLASKEDNFCTVHMEFDPVSKTYFVKGLK